MKKQLPKNWVECSLGEIAEWGSGGTPNRGIPSYYNGTIPWLKTGDLNDGLITEVKEYITELGLKNSSAKIFPKNSVVIAMYGATIGKTGMLNFASSTNQACAVAIPYLNMNKFIYLYLKSEKEKFIEKGKGGAQPNISQAVIKSHKINLPPLPEQNRIVEKLDNMFNQLETIKSSMANIPLLLKDFRQQVLSQAVTGKLTEEWRKGKEFVEVKSISLKEILIKVKNSIPEKKFLKGTFKYYDIGSIDNNNNTITESKEILVKDAPSRARQELLENDILLSTVRTYLKNTAIIDFPINEKNYASTGFYIIRVNASKALPRFIFYYVISDLFVNKLSEFQRGANYPAVRNGDVEKQEIILPSIEEQQEIVNRIGNLFSKADAVEQQYKTLKDKIDNLPQALLNKAFKGELSEQLDTDGDAKDLLKEIDALKNKLKKSKTK